MTESAIYLEKTSMNLDIGTMLISVVVSILVAIITAKVTIEINNVKNTKDEVNRAIELSAFFANEIIPMINYLRFISSQIDKKAIFIKPGEEANKCKKFEFDCEEALDIFGVDLFGKVKEPPLIEEVMQVDDKYFIAARILLAQTSSKEMLYYNDICISNKLYNPRAVYIDEFKRIKLKLLNNLEYFALNFCTEIADEETVYQSIHQVYRSTIILLYYDICYYNQKLSDKYFTNVIELFNTWNSRYCESVDMEEKYESERVRLEVEKAKKLEQEGNQKLQEKRENIVKKPKPYHKKGKKRH